MKLSKAIVITPTIGSPYLKNALESVIKQDFSDIVHLIVVDGEQFAPAVDLILKEVDCQKIKKIVLPFNTGYGLYNGHRIYAATSFLIESEFVFFLDEDNWYEQNHVSSLISLIEGNKLDWAYSLRGIFDHDLKYLTDDNCESLGPWRPFSNMDYLVDTSCYSIKRDVLMKVGHHWLESYFADRKFFKEISRFSGNFRSSGLHTLNYVLKKNNLPNAQFFYNGNRFMLKKYQNNLPWKQNQQREI